MAVYKCKNCGKVFVKNVQSASELVYCPECGSFWVEYLRPGLSLKKEKKMEKPIEGLEDEW